MARKISLQVGIVALLVMTAGVYPSTSPAVASDNVNAQNKIGICQATTNGYNPYNYRELDPSDIVAGTGINTGPVYFPGIDETWGDIIPPFSYQDQNGPEQYDGLNWDTDGQAIYNSKKGNGCYVEVGRMVIVKNTSGGNGTFDFTISGTSNETASVTTTNGTGKTNKLFVSPGDHYSVTETDQAGWNQTAVSCKTDEKADLDPTDFSVDEDHIVTCTFTNELDEGSTGGSNVQISAYKVVCQNESDLPNWGDNGTQTGEPAVITATTASDYVAASNGQCSLEPGWTFQWGFAEKDGTAGVNKLPGDLIGEADGTSTLGACNPTYCGVNTFTGTDYNDWKNFDTATSASGVATVAIADLQDASGIWVRENLQQGYVPFSYPPDSAPGSNVSAEMYCHNDIQNYDNYDEIVSPTLGQTYYCVAFNALQEDNGDQGGNGGNNGTDKGSITGQVFEDTNNNGVFDEGDNAELGGWQVYLDTNNNGSLDDGEPTETTASPYTFSNLDDGDYHVRLVLQSGWILTAPASGVYDVSIAGGNDVVDQDFGVFDDSKGGNNNSGSNGSSGSSGSSSSSGSFAPQVAGASTENPQPQPPVQPEVLGATTLPRTGTPVWILLMIPLLALAPLFVYRKKLN